MPAARIARVLIDSPLPQLDRLFDYRIPAGMDGVRPGIRVSVPLRSAGRLADAFVIELADQQDHPGPLSDLEAVVSPVPVLRPEVWALARAVATRAAGSASDVLRLAVPKRQVRVEKAWLARRETDGAPAFEGSDDVGALIEPAEIPGYESGAVASLIRRRGRAALAVPTGVQRLASGATVGRWAVTLAASAVSAVASGGSALLVAPDHRDVDQLLAALDGLLPDGDLLRWDATGSGPDRYRAVLAAADPRPRVIVGTRAAIWAPAERLALIAIWNDGDPLHLEQLAPYAHSRDAALIRQEQQGAALLLAGHSRTTDVQRLVELGFLDQLAPDRPSRPRVLPTASLVRRDEPGEQARIPSSAWRAARAGLDDGPVLVQVGRPGFAPGLACADCGQPARCAVCAGPLRLARAGAIPECRWCGTPAPAWRCAECGGSRPRPRGAGSVRTADELGRAFPDVRVVIADGEHPVLAVPDRPALVVATRGAEPVAASGYRAILLLDGERMVARESLRVGEDCVRWWSDAAALAADGAPVILVGVGGSLASALASGDLAGYAAAEFADRRALRFPPAVRSATLTGEPEAVAEAVAVVADLVDSEVWGLTPDPAGVRSLVRFDYARGAAVAEALRAEVIRWSTRRRRPAVGGRPRGRQPVPLRVRMDDPTPFAE